MVEKEFQYLRGYCLRAVEAPSRDSVRALNEALGVIDDGPVLQQLQEYVAVPLFEILRTRKRSEEMVLDAVKCLTKLLSLTDVTKWKLFSQIAFHVVMVVSNREDIHAVSVAHVSEELKSSVCACLTELLRKSDEIVLESAFGLNFLPQIGHMIYILLQLAESERSKQVRCSAMNCLRIFQGPLNANNKLRVLIGNCLANFIPGISTTMTKVATGSGLAGQAVTVTALRVWQELVCAVLGDNQLKAAQDLQVERPKLIQDVKHPVKVVVRNGEWLKDTSEKLAILAENLGQLDSNSNVKVRLALAEWAHTLLVECKISLSIAVPSFISVLITLSCDDFDNVSTFCKTALTHFGKTLQADEKSIVEVLQENLISLVLDLSRIRNSDDAKKFSTVNKLHGYFTVLGPTLNVVIHSAIHLEKLSLSLLQLVEIDCSDIRMVAERKNDTVFTLEELEQLGQQAMPKKFRHFRNNKIHDNVYQVCRLLGKFGDLQLLADHFMDQFHKSTIFRKEAALLLNYVMSGTQLRVAEDEAALKEELFQISSCIAEDYINPAVWDLPSFYEAKNSSVDDRVSYGRVLVNVGQFQPAAQNSVTQLNSNIIQMCLLLEGLGILAMGLKEKFRPLLIKILYEVLEKLGNDNILISQTSLLTVSKIAHFCSYDSISDLLLKNSDYLLNSVLLKLRYRPTDGKAPRVLCVTLQYGDCEMLNIIEDVIKEVCCSLDARPDDRSIPHLRVLFSLIKAITRWNPAQHPSVAPVAVGKPVKEINQESYVVDFIVEYHRLRQFSDNVSEDFTSKPAETCEENVVDEKNLVDEKKQTPKHVQLIVEVLQRCCHHLPSSNVSISLLILDIMDLSFCALQKHEDELLPMVHKTWSPLLQRFCDGDNLLIMKKAFHTLCVVCMVCSDFVRGRVVKEIWPKLIRFLEKQVTISVQKDASFNYTMAYKLLLEILLNVGDLVIILQVSELDVDRLSSAAIYYLSRHQQTAVQAAAVNLFEKLLTWTPDLIWLKLSDLFSDTSCYVHTKHGFEVVKVAGCTRNEEFAENISKLLKKLER